MTWRAALVAAGCAGVASLAFMAWLLTAPGATGFAGGRRVTSLGTMARRSPARPTPSARRA